MRELAAFSPLDVYEMLKLRVDVFVVEQACAYPELDGKDGEALHLRLLDNADLLACARLWQQPDGALPRIGRVAVSPAHRGKRLGEALMREAIAECEARFRGQPIAISAQSHLQRFYEGLGFVVTSAEYVEDGIRHVDMERPVR
ncbi:ElaA protein [Pseudorhizobium tarimense]|uniref:ElaA protein n=1 Tax=Pseudorhizobium tarimense TaxID=1079109 RepID=A0ABV2HA30_9HYPH